MRGVKRDQRCDRGRANGQKIVVKLWCTVAVHCGSDSEYPYLVAVFDILRTTIALKPVLGFARTQTF